MAISQAKSKLSPTGKKYKDYRKKKQHELGSAPTMTKIGESKRKQERVIGGNIKQRNLELKEVNLYDEKTKKCSKVAVKTVVESGANRFFVRRNVVTKGTIVDTEKGKAKITSRPGQEGTVNAVLVK